MNSIPEKKCGSCRNFLPLSEFSNNKRFPDGLQPSCKVCQKKAHDRWYAKHGDEDRERKRIAYSNNPNTQKERTRKYKEEHPEEYKLSKKKWRDNNHERQIEAQKKYRKEHPEMMQASRLKWAVKNPDYPQRRQVRRNERIKSNGGEIDVQDWINLCSHYGNKCLCCGAENIEITLDHVIPLSCGGTNTIDNVQPLCRVCNSRKGVKSTDYRY